MTGKTNDRDFVRRALIVIALIAGILRRNPVILFACGTQLLLILLDPSPYQYVYSWAAIPTPFWTYVYYHGEKWKEYGQDKMQWMFAHRSFLDTGTPVPPSCR